MASQLQIKMQLGTLQNPDSMASRLYGEVCDATPASETDPWRSAALVGNLPSLAKYALGYQREIILTLMKLMVQLQAPADGLTRRQPGVYVWRFSCKED